MNLDRIITILETISHSGRSISATEIHPITNIPKPTCYRAVEQLLFHGLLDDPNDNGKYLVGEKLRTIAMAGIPDKDICLAISPLLQETAKKFDEAETNYRKAIALKTDFAQAHNNLGVMLSELEKSDIGLYKLIEKYENMLKPNNNSS